MNDLLGILAALLAVIAIGAVVRYHSRQRAKRTTGARALGWEPVHLPANLRLRWQGELTLTRIGHSRRIESVYQRPGPRFLLYYRCETGFEHRRNSHRWLAIAATTGARIARATVSTEDWLLAAAQLPGMSRIAIGDASGADPHAAVVEDAQQWHSIASGPTGAWLRNQPARRSWEFLPGIIVGYEGMGSTDRAIDSLSTAMNELLATLGHETSSEAPSDASGSGSLAAFGVG